MNLKELENKTILLFGKSRAFSSEEFESQMRHHKITVLKEYSDEVVLSIDGRMMTPYEQNASDDLYENKNIKSISIDELERALAKEIDADVLLMSLKLSHDKERLKAFIKNTMISDELFFRLLKMYAWDGEDFFENDDNRDVTAALIGRFYENIERNHNVQYATLGLMHLVAQCKNEKLIETIALLEPLQKSLNAKKNSANFAIVTAIAKHPKTPKSVLKTFVKKANTYVQTLIALRENCDAMMQEQLFIESDENVLEALSRNANLDKAIVKQLLSKERFAKNIGQFIRLDEELFELLFEKYALVLAANESLTLEMQERLYQTQSEEVKAILGANSLLQREIIEKLSQEESQIISSALYANAQTPHKILQEAYANAANHTALAKNSNTPEEILLLLGQSEETQILAALAKNESTPVEVLYQLQLDSRFERLVKENAAFGKHIQTQNIGWMV
ncbi:MAG: hypothetical protein FP820_08415 [Sulfurimonas sp.]|nr:hypothetical protein [Sulfurimonas sp.]MBU3940111.1 hypothetical protein [bacterium]MBU4025526.1 hypothetical protein [bacterium]MBU4060092.1 hypothetical protein [bacterium]